MKRLFWRVLFLNCFLLPSLAGANQIPLEQFQTQIQDKGYRGALEERGIQKVQEIVSNNAVTDTNQGRYCTGYLCEHFTADFCDRASDSCKKAASGNHSLVFVRQELELPEGKGVVEYYCIYEPQMGATLQRNLCWLRHPNDSSLKAWQLPPEIDRNYRNVFAGMLEPTDPPFEVGNSAPYATPWRRWWENIFMSDGQLMSVCEQQNTLMNPSGSDPVFDALPSEMPKCKDQMMESCKSDSPAQACNLKTPAGRNVCQPILCKDKQWTTMRWEWVDLPSCTKAKALNDYCGKWKDDFTGFWKTYKHKWKYAAESTRHYCRNVAGRENENYGIKQFTCDETGTASYNLEHIGRYLPTRPAERVQGTARPLPVKNDAHSQ